MTKKHYICSNCGNISPKWSGQCFDCGVWGSIVEEIVSANQAIVKVGSKQDFDKLSGACNRAVTHPYPYR